MASKNGKLVLPQLIIPMTGISSRFTAAGYDRPKFLLETDGQTVLEHVLDMYPGWDDVVFICNATHLANPIWGLEELILRKRPKAKILSVKNKYKGPGEVILEAAEFIAKNRAVVVNYCDFSCFWDANDYANKLVNSELDGLIPVYSGFHPHMVFSTAYAYPKVVDNWVVDIQEKKPWTDNPLTEYVSSGTYGFASGTILLEGITQQINKGYKLGDEYYISLTYKALLDKKAKIGVYEIQHFMQWGTPQDFEEYQDFSKSLQFWANRPSFSENFQQKNSRVILASGAGKRFFAAGYKDPKPLLPLLGKPLLEHALSGIPGAQTVVVTRDDLPGCGELEDCAKKINAEIVSLAQLTRGQAESALIGLRKITSSTDPVTVAACDAIALVSENVMQEAIDHIGDDGVAVWLAKPYHLANRKPQQYGWVQLGEKNRVLQTWIKEKPNIADAAVITGTFTFASAKSAINHIENLVKDGVMVNGEFYLDSLLARLLEQKFPVVGIIADSFISAGTPIEYETLKYWLVCFHKWALHPYSLTTDSIVRRTDRADLDANFRKFERSIGEYN